MKADLANYEYRVKSKRHGWWDSSYPWKDVSYCDFAPDLDYEFRKKAPFEPDYYRVCRGATDVRYTPIWCDAPPWWGILGYMAYQKREDWERVAITRKED